MSYLTDGLPACLPACLSIWLTDTTFFLIKLSLVLLLFTTLMQESVWKIKMCLTVQLLFGPRHIKTCIRVCGQRRLRSACASTQSDQGFHCPPTESLATTKCMNGDQRLCWYFAHAEHDLNLRMHFAHIRRHCFAWCCHKFYYVTV